MNPLLKIDPFSCEWLHNINSFERWVDCRFASHVERSRLSEALLVVGQIEDSRQHAYHSHTIAKQANKFWPEQISSHLMLFNVGCFTKQASCIVANVPV